MKLVVGESNGKIAASGSCSMQLLVDGSKKYTYRGTWHGTLTWSNGGFAYDGTFLCDEAKA
jgi:inosine/xanthosine triphosphate pyrophosphatase family protein